MPTREPPTSAKGFADGRDSFAQVSQSDALSDPALRDEVSTSWQVLLDHLRCPESLKPLHYDRSANELTEESQGRRWPVVGGMPWFARDRHHYHADVPEEHMRRLVTASLEHGWRAAFHALLGELPPTHSEIIRENVLDSIRAHGLTILPLDQKSRVLDLGCGWGSLSLPLAEQAGLVVGMDLASLRARFTQIRAAQEKLDNLVVMVGGDSSHLPFEDGFFDAVLLNGVLEWTAVSKEGPPWVAYRELLTEIRRVLCPGGSLYIGIENRTGLSYFKGSPEDHIELPYISLLPRPLADVYARRRRGRPYRTHTHARGGYRKLLQQSGYERIRFYCPHPNYRIPRLVFPLEDHDAMLRLVAPPDSSAPRRILMRVLSTLGILELLPNSYLILASKG